MDLIDDKIHFLTSIIVMNGDAYSRGKEVEAAPKDGQHTKTWSRKHNHWHSINKQKLDVQQSFYLARHGFAEKLVNLLHYRFRKSYNLV